MDVALHIEHDKTTRAASSASCLDEPRTNKTEPAQRLPRGVRSSRRSKEVRSSTGTGTGMGRGGGGAPSERRKGRKLDEITPAGVPRRARSSSQSLQRFSKGDNTRWARSPRARPRPGSMIVVRSLSTAYNTVRLRALACCSRTDQYSPSSASSPPDEAGQGGSQERAPGASTESWVLGARTPESSCSTAFADTCRGVFRTRCRLG
ncbi:hypothetical protein C8Q73DRAFT_296502 [Cubamyces lactineus]|nr:hypothetical protein C8Q73DRAFT_296502 [Cubamyces lactineus]